MIARRPFLAGLAGTLALPNVVDATPWPSGHAAALCIGLSEYPGALRLATPVRDMNAIAVSLRSLGFGVETAANLTRDSVLQILARFHDRARDADLALIYVAGHGVMVEGEVHVFPIDAPLAAPSAWAMAIPERVFVRAIADRPRRKVLMVDACRSLPFDQPPRPAAAASPYFGLAGLFSAYATQPGALAFDGADGHSPFAKALSHRLRQPGLPIDDLFRHVRVDVIRQTSGLQVPWTRSSLLRQLSLHPATG